MNQEVPEWRGQPFSMKAMSEETERLFQKWLKIQIAQYYWNMFFKVVVFLLVIGSLVFSTITLAPLLESQLGVLQQLQSSVNMINGKSSNSQTDTINQLLNQINSSKK
ncbi:hypothetical protein GYA49_03860 [Candidatus Beckwithbacteria bacterium]|nr:hypothetical protein [Candidatus Beckwithbacteria bacterium]